MDLVRLIQHPELMNKETLYELRSLVALYPYYQTARLLMLQNMYLMHDSAFDDELHRAALYVSDRSLLFAHYKIKTAQEIADEKSANSAAQRDNATAGNRTISLIDSYLETAKPDNDNEAQQSKSKPTPADAAIDYVAYLLKQENEDEEKTDNDSPQLKGQELIDDFINNDGGKIQLQDKPTYKPEINNEDNTSNDNDEGYFTETLAKIYIKQGRYSKALEIIQRLNLNYPKKSAYFADQIRFLKKLIINEKSKKQ